MSTATKVDRNAILDLAGTAIGHRNESLRDLLLVVAGMLDPDGNVVALPDDRECWDQINSISGAWGKGFALWQARTMEGR